MNRAFNNEQWDQHASEWLDLESESPAGARRPMESDVWTRDAEIRIADMQLIDAMLSMQSQETRDRQSARIQRVMASIDPPAVPASKRRLTVAQRVVVLAASVLIALGVVWTQFASDSNASVILREISAATRQNIDRVYDIRRESAATSQPQTKSEGRLYLRGRQSFVLQCGETTLGRTEDEFWLVPSTGDVLLGDDFRWMVSESDPLEEIDLLRELAKDSRRVPIMNLAAVVELMAHDYEITVRRERDDSASEHEITAIAKENVTSLPKTITLRADATSNIIRRAEFDWGREKKLVLEQAPAEQVPANWYQRESHYNGQRETRRMPVESP